MTDSDRGWWLRLKCWYWKLVPYEYRPRTLWYRLTCWAWHRYHTVRCRSLPSTWNDRDVVVVHAVFEVLGRFVEEESPERWEEGDGSERAELRELWRWWLEVWLPWEQSDQWKLEGVEHPKLELVERAGGRVGLEHKFSTPLARELYSAAVLAMGKREEEMENELTAKLKRVMELRRYLWS